MKGRNISWLFILSLGALLVAAACGGKAIIDPPLGSGGAGGAGVGSVSTVSTSSGIRSCEEIADAYQEELASARHCDPDVNAVQCTEPVQDGLLCPCRDVYVNPDTSGFAEVDALIRQWKLQGCSPSEDCPRIACVQPESGACIDSDPGSSSPGTCVDK